jgi:hypothetical protein
MTASRENARNGAPILTRKAKEVALTHEITQRFSKCALLGYYLNSIFYGNPACSAEGSADISGASATAVSALAPWSPTPHRPAGSR